MKALLVEDDRDIASFLKAHLPECGIAADVAHDGAEGIRLARVNEYDVAIVDINLPEKNGEEVCKAIRKKKHSMPVLMLTVFADVSTKVRLLNAGADDYLVKPFAFEELVARLRALMRRPAATLPPVLNAEGLTLDVARQTAHRRKRELLLTRKEFALLECLMRHEGAVVSKTALIEHIWDSDADLFSDAVETHVRNLRLKLGKPSVIHTVHGRGYRLG